MAGAIREYAPVTVIGKDDTAGNLVGRRFMGTLLRPVPRVEMGRRCGVDRAGMKVVADWPVHADSCPAAVGQEVEIEGRRYRICGVVERPGCYLELYLSPE